jgi:hypothetical protein
MYCGSPIVAGVPANANQIFAIFPPLVLSSQKNWFTVCADALHVLEHVLDLAFANSLPFQRRLTQRIHGFDGITFERFYVSLTACSAAALSAMPT